MLSSFTHLNNIAVPSSMHEDSGMICESSQDLFLTCQTCVSCPNSNTNISPLWAICRLPTVQQCPAAGATYPSPVYLTLSCAAPYNSVQHSLHISKTFNKQLCLHTSIVSTKLTLTRPRLSICYWLLFSQ